MGAGRFLLAAMVAACAAIAASGAAEAQVSVRCDLNPTTALSDAISSNVVGTVFEITGICQGTIEVATTLELANHLGADALEPGDGIQGELVIAGPAFVFIDGITLEGTASDTGLPDVLEVDGTATVAVENTQIINGQRDGLAAAGTATVGLINTTISGNGVAHIAGQSDGISATGTVLQLGTTNDDGTVNTGNAVTITNNVGNGIALFGHTQLAMAGGMIEGNGGNQAFLAGASEVELLGTEVIQSQTPTMPGDFAIQALAGSTIWLFSSASVSGGNVAGAILVASTGSLLMNNATVTSSLLSVPTIEISGSSNGVLGGGNTLQNTAPGGGTVLQLDHASSFQQVALAAYQTELLEAPVSTTATPDSLSGSAFVQEQSQMDIGMGTISGNPSLTWSVPAGDCILVQQNSSIRVSGGVTMAGAAPSACALNGGTLSSTIVIQQESNGFFNLGAGGSDVISGGGSVSCVFTSFPNAHVNGKGNIAPAGAQPVMIGNLTQALNATSPGCLGP
jgi:hypothetical protein